MVDNDIIIPAAREKKEKLIKWYGWIPILLAAFTPLIILILPRIMVNTNRINKLLKESRVSEESFAEGCLVGAKWELKQLDGLNLISGELEVDTGDFVKQYSFQKYVGFKNANIPEINENSRVRLTGREEPGGTFAIRNLYDLSAQRVYTTEPSVSVY